jgi:hypothetical protein
LPFFRKHGSSNQTTDERRPLPTSEYSHNLRAEKNWVTTRGPASTSSLLPVHDRSFQITSNGMACWGVDPGSSSAYFFSCRARRGTSCSAAYWIGLSSLLRHSRWLKGGTWHLPRCTKGTAAAVGVLIARAGGIWGQNSEPGVTALNGCACSAAPISSAYSRRTVKLCQVASLDHSKRNFVSWWTRKFWRGRRRVRLVRGGARMASKYS